MINFVIIIGSAVARSKVVFICCFTALIAVFCENFCLKSWDFSTRKQQIEI